MAARRTLSWNAALQDLRADRETPSEIREERLRATAGLKGNPPQALTAWRGLSSKRFVFAILDVDAAAVREKVYTSTDVLLAVFRDASGVATPLRAGAVSAETAEAVVAKAAALGANELHIHNLAATPAERSAVIKDLTPVVALAAEAA